MTIRSARTSIAQLAVVVLAAACGAEPTGERSTTADEPAASTSQPTTSAPTSIAPTTTSPTPGEVPTTIGPTTSTAPARVVVVRNAIAGTVSIQGRGGTTVRITRCDRGSVAIGDPVLTVMAHCTLSVGPPHRLDADGTANIAMPPPGSDLTGRALAEDADVVAIDADTALPIGVAG